MRSAIIISGKPKNLLSNPILWVVFLLYLIIAGYTMIHHEIWGDEFHSWNIAKASGNFFDLISNTRYEGHPPVWYIILWITSKFTHDPTSIQFVHFALASLVVFVMLFFSPFPLAIKSLVPFGYFFLFEYAVLSRNYAIGILLALCICIIINKNFKGQKLLYYILLFLLSNTSLFAMLLAVSFHIYFLLSLKEQKEKYGRLLIYLLLGIVILIPSVYFIFPPGDSSIGTIYWLSRWNKQHLASIVYSPIRAFAPIPIWFEYHFWDTNFFIGTASQKIIPKWLALSISLGLFLFSIFVLKNNKKSLLFFVSYLSLAFLIFLVIPFTNERHLGFIFIAFLAALWFYNLHQPLNKIRTYLILVVLLGQVLGSAIAVSKDIKYPFSNASKVKELLGKIPHFDNVVTDYWCLNTLSAFSDKSFYCIELQKETSYLLWNSELYSALTRPNRSSSGLINFLNNKSITKVYMISIQSPQNLHKGDTSLSNLFNIMLIDKKEGAIEKGGNVYLYEITSR